MNVLQVNVQLNKGIHMKDLKELLANPEVKLRLSRCSMGLVHLVIEGSDEPNDEGIHIGLILKTIMDNEYDSLIENNPLFKDYKLCASRDIEPSTTISFYYPEVYDFNDLIDSYRSSVDYVYIKINEDALKLFLDINPDSHEPNTLCYIMSTNEMSAENE